MVSIPDRIFNNFGASKSVERRFYINNTKLANLMTLRLRNFEIFGLVPELQFHIGKRLSIEWH